MSHNAIDLLKKSAERFPGKLALADQSNEISYAELSESAESIGTRLAESGFLGKPIVVFCERELESIVSFWGVVRSGNFYVPIDASTPISRIRTYLQIIEPAAVIFREKQRSKLSELILPHDVTVYMYEEMMNTPINEPLLERIYRSLTMKDPLYLVFTSGSTGIPKGVLKTHRSLMSFIEEFVPLFNFDENDTFGNQASFDFDIAAKDIYASASVGATLQIIPSICFMVPKKLPAFLRERKVNTLIWSVAAMNYVVNAKVFECEMPTSIRKVLFSGEALAAKILNEWRKNIPSATYVNLYAPSEVTGNCLYHVADRFLQDDERLPLGSPFPNMRVFLLNENQQETMDGELGELYIAGEFLASGYYNNNDLTQTAFIQNPINNRYPEIVYRTGDLAQFRNGELFFVSRKDYQIKHMGHRIELGEIESIVNEMDDVEHSNCFLDRERQQLVLAVFGNDLDTDKIKEKLKEKVPKYMLPHKIIRLEKFPLNARGKADREKIQEMYERSR